MARMAAHKTQQELVGDTYSKSYLSAVERGKQTPSFQALLFLANQLRVPVSYFLGEDKSRPMPVADPQRGAHSPFEHQEQSDVEQWIRLSRAAEDLLEQGRYQEATEVLWQHLEAANQSGDARTRGVALGVLAALHTSIGNCTHALALAQEALELAQAQRDHATMGQVYLTLVTTYATTHNEAAAEQVFQKAIIAWRLAGNRVWLSHTYEQFGHFLAARKRYQEAYEQLCLAQVQTRA